MKTCDELFHDVEANASAAKEKYAAVVLEFEFRADRIDNAADAPIVLIQSNEKQEKEGLPAPVKEQYTSLQFSSKKDIASVEPGKKYKIQARFESFDGKKLLLTNGTVFNQIYPPVTEKPVGGGVGRAPTK